MKMYLGGKPINKMKVKHYSMDTNDADLQASDMQSGKVAYAKGKKVIGTGKAFEFASYGKWKTNLPFVIPTTINVIQVSSVDYNVKSLIPLYDVYSVDFSNSQKIAEITIDEIVYPITASIQSGTLTVSCEETIDIQLFIGKDNYR